MAKVLSSTISNTFKIPSTACLDQVGNLYYDTTDNKLKITVLSGGVFSNLSNLPSNGVMGEGAGTQNAAIIWGGNYLGPSQNVTCEYNGSAWSSGGTVAGYQYRQSGAGTQNATISYAGGGPLYWSNTLTYNGSTWSNASISMTPGREFASTSKVGTQNATVVYSGCPSAYSKCTTEFNGSAWSAGGAIAPTYSPFAGQGHGTGTLNAAFLAGGAYTQTFAAEYNGTSWSTVTSLPEQKSSGGVFGAQDSAIVAAGRGIDFCSLTSYRWNGSAWGTVGNSNCYHHCPYDLGPNGNSTGNMLVGGAIPYPGSNSVEAFDGTQGMIGLQIGS